jgi:lipopolysaccharide biosynthesis protein
MFGSTQPQRVWYPVLPGVEFGHEQLAWTATGYAGRDLDPSILTRLAREAVEQGCHSLILSSEEFIRAFPDRVSCLSDLRDFGDLQVVVTLSPFNRRAVSLWQELTKHGHMKPLNESLAEIKDCFVEHWLFTQLAKDFAGCDIAVVAASGPNSPGALFQWFSTATGLPELGIEGAGQMPVLNRSLSEPEANLLCAFNLACGIYGIASERQVILRNQLRDLFDSQSWKDAAPRIPIALPSAWKDWLQQHARRTIETLATMERDGLISVFGDLSSLDDIRADAQDTDFWPSSNCVRAEARPDDQTAERNHDKSGIYNGIFVPISNDERALHVRREAQISDFKLKIEDLISASRESPMLGEQSGIDRPLRAPRTEMFLIDQLDRLLRELKEQNASSDAQIERHEQTIASLIEQTVEQSRSIAALTEKAAEQSTKIAEQSQALDALASLRQMIANVQVSLGSRDRAITRLRQELDQRKIEARLLQHELSARDALLQNVSRQPLFKLQKTIRRAQKRLFKPKSRQRSPHGAISRRDYDLVRASRFFDAQWYLSQYPDVARSNVDPLVHYLQCGDREDRNPNPNFNTRFYRTRYPDVAKSGISPLIHYLRHGIGENREIVPPDVNSAAEPDTATGVTEGTVDEQVREVRASVIKKLFDREFYLCAYPDVSQAGEDPLQHFVGYGWREGRKPSPDADLETLAERHPEVKAAFFGVAPGDRSPQNYQYLMHHENQRQMAGSARDATEHVSASIETIDAERCPVKTIAFYLPQFHPIPENDSAWGKGFTEWTNVSKAVAEFVGHYQPHLPGELGFYDLRLREVMVRQVELAKQYGIHGFCFHHYWFGGKRVLEKPVQAFLADQDLDINFCLCWANENWTRGWDGDDRHVILGQRHSPEDDLAFIADLVPAFLDPRYIRIEGRPVLLVYRPGVLPDPAATVQRWREYCRGNGIGEIFLVYAQTFGIDDHPSTMGFDAAVQFPPHLTSSPEISSSVTLLNPTFHGKIYDYRVLPGNAASAPPPAYPLFPTAFPSWDNTARRPGRGHMFAYATPGSYRDWLTTLFQRAKVYLPPDRQFVFINAWNEWAEGAHLEPDRRYGYAWLTATASVIREHTKVPEEVETEVARSTAHFQKKSDTLVIVHLYYGDLTDEFIKLLRAVPDSDAVITLPNHVSAETVRLLRCELPKARLMLVENCGRDVLPFLSTLSLARELGYDLLVKVHSKRSPNRDDGEQLRADLVHGLLDARSFARVRAAFVADRKLGMVGTSRSWQSLSVPTFLVNNRTHMIPMLQSIGVSEEILPSSGFFAGTMFWARVAALDWVQELGLSRKNFEAEWGQTDGTTAHALERIFAIGVQARGHKIATLDTIRDVGLGHKLNFTEQATTDQHAST